jgi:hypothetical protein
MGADHQGGRHEGGMTLLRLFRMWTPDKAMPQRIVVTKSASSQTKGCPEK